jgi:hypothetical protein
VRYLNGSPPLIAARIRRASACCVPINARIRRSGTLRDAHT